MPAVDQALCPLCSAPNGCDVLHGKGTCWCFHEKVDGDLVSWLAERGLDTSCLCVRCATGDVPSPCTGSCSLDAASQTCGGCRRTLSEIASWSRMTAVERTAVLLRLRKGCGST